jgi:hypothetical protein
MRETGTSITLDRDDLVDALLTDPTFHVALGDVGRERLVMIAEAAVTAMLAYVGLASLVLEVQHEVSGHG